MKINVVLYSLLAGLLSISITALADAVIIAPPKQRILPSNNEVIDAVAGTLRVPPANAYENRIDIQYNFAPNKPLNLNGGNTAIPLNLAIEIDQTAQHTESPNELMHKGYKAALVGQYEAALFLYKKAQVYDVENPSLLFAIGTLYHKLQQLDQASIYYKKVLVLQPTHRKALNNFIAVIGEQSPQGALQELQRLEKANANYSPVIAQLGVIYAQLGQFQLAENYFHRAIVLSPRELLYKYNLATMYDHYGKKTAALKLYKEILDYGATTHQLPQSYNEIKQRMFVLISEVQKQ